MTIRTVILASLAVFVFAASAPADILIYTTDMNGANEAPPNASPGTGTSMVTIDTVAVTMRVEASFSGLIGNVSAAHIHCCTATPFTGTVGVATPTPTFPGFPSGVTAGNYDQTFDLTQPSSWNAAFITANGGTVDGALNAFLAGLEQGRAYFNIHSTEFPGGEIRGFMVPEPTAGLALLIGLGLLGLRRRAA